MSVVVCALPINTAYGWQQEYAVDAMSGHTVGRYIRDSGHQPRYNDILEECIRSTQNVAGPVVSLTGEAPMDVTSGISMGWNFPLSRQVTAGPAAMLCYDGSTISTYNEFSNSATSVTQSDPLRRTNVSSLGWRVNSQFDDVRPWTQISYNQRFGENIWKVQSGLGRILAVGQDGNWVDITTSADVLLNLHMTAYVALSQTENSTNNNDYTYTVGVNAKF